MGKRSTQATVAQRVEEVLQIILLGGEIHDLREHAREMKWNVSDGQLRRYQTDALEVCKGRIEKDRDKLFARHLLQRRTLYARAMEANDLRTALAVVKDEAELQGIYPAKQHEHTGGVKLQIVEEIVDDPIAAKADRPAASDPKPVPAKPGTVPRLRRRPR